MIGEAACFGAATMLNAIPTGKGCAFGIGLRVDVRVTLEKGASELEVVTEPKVDSPELVRGCVRAVLGHFQVPDVAGGRIEVRSEIPVSRGLKSSSAVANATILAAARALGKTIDDQTLLVLGAEEAIRARVSLTGAFDDACACYFGGLVLTENAKRKILLKDKLERGLKVLLHIPKRQIPKRDLTTEMFARAIPDANRALDLILQGHYFRALDLNGAAISRVLGLDPRIAQEAKKVGAVAAGITGTGPATVILCRENALDRVRSVVDTGDAELRLTTLNSQKATEVQPRSSS